MSKRHKQRKPSTRQEPRSPAKSGQGARKRHLATVRAPFQRQFEFASEGRYFDLRAIFDKLNARYFRNRLRRYAIVWGQRRRERPQSYIVFGSIQEEDRIIRIHPLLDRQFVPQWYLEYVVFHEMLHAVVPDRYDPAGRRIVHHEGFLERERRFRHYRRSRAWEEENLGRFLR
ncbi:MAG: hypothetical protein ABI318_15680 [Chthoniobacteraceae bacterium]